MINTAGLPGMAALRVYIGCTQCRDAARHVCAGGEGGHCSGVEKSVYVRLG